MSAQGYTRGEWMSGGLCSGSLALGRQLGPPGPWALLLLCSRPCGTGAFPLAVQATGAAPGGKTESLME